MSEYLLEIKKSVDALALIGSPISNHNHVESILDRLASNYESFITSLLLKSKVYSNTKLEAQTQIMNKNSTQTI